MYVVKTKTLISCVATLQLTYAFFVYAYSRSSHDTAHVSLHCAGGFVFSLIRNPGKRFFIARLK